MLLFFFISVFFLFCFLSLCVYVCFVLFVEHINTDEVVHCISQIYSEIYNFICKHAMTQFQAKQFSIVIRSTPPLPSCTVYLVTHLEFKIALNNFQLVLITGYSPNTTKQNKQKQKSLSVAAGAWCYPK